MLLQERPEVSIHAPARGATEISALDVRAGAVSIHAPARGATRATRGKPISVLFQSTRPRGARQHEASASRSRQIVSIHAPARGATLERRGHLPAGIVSIHAPARGATAGMSNMRPLNLFQSTRPRGARRHGSDGLFAARRGFNPRAREGRDKDQNSNWNREEVSIHAPARGATITGISSFSVSKMFQSTRPRGARQ